MRVLHVIGSFDPVRREGGLQEATLHLCHGLQRHGVDVSIATTNAGDGKNLNVPLDRALEVEGLSVRYFHRFPRLRYLPCAGLLGHLRQVVRDYDLVHTTGLFTFPGAAAARTAHDAGIPYVVAPSGMCRPWALSHRAWKKRPYWRAIEQRNLTHAAAVHATSDMEAEELSGMLPDSRVFVVPNAVDTSSGISDERRRPHRVVFLGRLHPIKGLDVLIDAMSELTAAVPEAELVIAGRDEVGLWPELVRRVNRLTPRARVTYVGVVSGEAKSRLLASASALALTSHSESFGMVVAEALARGTPVVTTRGCPWECVEEHGAGFWVPRRKDEIARALRKILSAPDRGATMQRAARVLAASFSPERVGAAMKERYLEILNETPIKSLR